jgi:hypothetical protein
VLKQYIFSNPYFSTIAETNALLKTDELKKRHRRYLCSDYIVNNRLCDTIYNKQTVIPNISRLLI